MFTWLLWQALRTPPKKNPIYKQMLSAQRPSWLDRFWNSLVVVLLVMLLVQPPIFVITLLIIPIAYPLLSSTCYGVLFSLRTSSMIFARRQQGSYDLIRIAPDGAWETFWAACAGSVHYNGDLDRLNHYIVRIMTMIFTLAMFTFLGGFVVPTERLQIEFMTMAIVLFTAMTLMYLEFTQSSILSTLIGMTFAIYARTAVDSRMGSLVGFLWIQFATYMTSALLVVNILYPLMVTSDISPVAGLFMSCMILIAYIATLREVTLWILWRMISWRLNTTQDALRTILPSNTFPWIKS